MYAGEHNICGVILSAGISTRFGTDKLSNHIAGQPLVTWAIKAACESELKSVTVVCQNKLLPYLPPNPKLQTIINPKPQNGQASSLRLGLRAISDHASHILFQLADQPLVTSVLINRFVNLAKSGNTLACLKSDDYIGPPALFGKKWFDRLMEMGGDSGAKKILISQRKNLKFVHTKFKGQEYDIDCQNDILKVERLILEDLR